MSGTLLASEPNAPLLYTTPPAPMVGPRGNLWNPSPKAPLLNHLSAMLNLNSLASSALDGLAEIKLCLILPAIVEINIISVACCRIEKAPKPYRHVLLVTRQSRLVIRSKPFRESGWRNVCTTNANANLDRLGSGAGTTPGGFYPEV